MDSKDDRKKTLAHGIKQTILEGYNKFVIRNENICWDWSGCCPKNPGYGEFRFEMKRIRAHRASWIIHFGDIPDGMFVLHKCDNKRCSNPEHLFLGKDKENSLDHVAKGRNKILFRKGQDNPNAKLKNELIPIIKELSKYNSFSEIGKRMNVSTSTILNIIKGKSWKEVL